MAVLLRCILAGPDRDILGGLVAWARHGCTTLEEGLERARALYTKLGKVGSTRTMRLLVQNLLDGYDEALPLVERILVEWDGSEASGTDDAAEVRGTKRTRDTCTFLQAAASWAHWNLKRVRVSEAWCHARPAAFAAVVADQSAADEEIEAAVSAWAENAQPSAVSEALRCLGPGIHPQVYAQLLDVAHEKSLSLEQQNLSLQGNTLRESLAAAAAAQQETAAAKAEALALRSSTQRAVAEADAARAAELLVRDELASERRRHASIEAEIAAAVLAVLERPMEEKTVEAL